MSATTVQSIQSSYLQDNLFALKISQKPQQLLIDMELFSSYLHTNAFPQTLPILQAFHPTVLRSQCFNDDNLPFSVEVQNTEIGHLFEHILLAYLCELKLERGVERVTYNGVTNWNWTKDAQGIFHITIDAGQRDQDVLPQALEKSIQLLTLIMTSVAGISPKTKQIAN